MTPAPCPNCGGRELCIVSGVRPAAGHVQIECRGCRMRGPASSGGAISTRAEVIEAATAWNRIAHAVASRAACAELLRSPARGLTVDQLVAFAVLETLRDLMTPDKYAAECAKIAPTPDCAKETP
jgi:hypothetical protein